MATTTLSIVLLPVGLQLVQDRRQVLLVRDGGLLIDLIPVQLSFVYGGWVIEAAVSNLNLSCVILFISEEGLAHPFEDTLIRPINILCESCLQRVHALVSLDVLNAFL